MELNEKYFQADPMQLNKLEDILEENETVLWREKPNKKSYICAAVFKMLPIAILWLAFDSFFIVMMIRGIGGSGMPWYFVLFMVFFFGLHLIPVWIWIGGIIRAVHEVKNIEYALTQKRVIVRSGIIGIDFKSLFYTEMQGVTTRVGLIDKIFKVGDIYINAATQSAVLFDVPDPYGLTAKLQKVVLDIQTDIHYPNALRPDGNPGYNTSYNASPFDKRK